MQVIDNAISFRRVGSAKGSFFKFVSYLVLVESCKKCVGAQKETDNYMQSSS